MLKSLLSNVGVLAVLCLPCAKAQTSMPADAKPSFEVVTIEPSPADERGQGFDMQGQHILLHRESVLNIIMFAYSVHPKQVIDAPDWVSSQFFDVDGVPDVQGEPNLVQYQYLLKRLLAERFGLVMHKDKRESGYYACV